MDHRVKKLQYGLHSTMSAGQRRPHSRGHPTGVYSGTLQGSREGGQGGHAPPPEIVTLKFFFLWAAWNLRHSVKFSAYFWGFCVGALPQTPPRVCPCMDPTAPLVTEPLLSPSETNSRLRPCHTTVHRMLLLCAGRKVTFTPCFRYGRSG